MKLLVMSRRRSGNRWPLLCKMGGGVYQQGLGDAGIAFAHGQQPWLLFFCSRAPVGADCVRPWGQEVLPSCSTVKLRPLLPPVSLEQPHCSMCMRRLRTDEIDTVPAPSSRLSVQQRVAVSNRQDECVAECFGSWQPSEVDWHASKITPVSPIYWRAPGDHWVSQQRHSVQPTATAACTY